MLSTLLATMLVGTQQKLPICYIPKAKTQILFTQKLVPRVMDAETQKGLMEKPNAETLNMWEGVASAANCSLYHYTYSPTKRPKLTVKEMAEGFYLLSKEIYAGFKDDPEMTEKFNRKFANRTVTAVRVGSYEGYLDSHEDLGLNQSRRILAWGDQNDQWVFELRGDKRASGIESALKLIVEYVKPIEQPLSKLAKGDLETHLLYDIGYVIDVPAAFWGRASAPDSSRKAIKNQWYSLSLGNDMSLDLHYDAYDDQKLPNIDADLNYMVSSFKQIGRTIKGQASEPVKIGDLSGKITFVTYTEGGKGYAFAWLSVAKPGHSLFCNFKASDAAGGKAKIQAIIKSLKPIPKK